MSGLLRNSPGNGFTKQLLVPQVALTCTQIWWTTEVGIAFARLEEGYESAMKDYYKKQVAQLKTLITMLIGPLSKGDRQKIMTICTIDVHARDVVAKMIAQKVGAIITRYVSPISRSSIWTALIYITTGSVHQLDEERGSFCYLSKLPAQQYRGSILIYNGSTYGVLTL